MQKTKHKKGISRHNKFIFLVLWFIGHLLAWGGLWLFVVSPLFMEDFGNNVQFGFLGFIVGGITSLVQYSLIRWQFGRNIKWWIPLSILAWIFASIISFQASGSLTTDYNNVVVSISALALYLPPVIVQYFLLRKHIRQAWLWIIGSIAASTIFALLINGEVWQIFAGFGLYSIVTGSTLLLLFGMSKASVQQKMADTAHERLQDSTNDDSQEQIDAAEQNMQRKMK